MPGREINAGGAEARAVDRAFATIAYALDGTILRANANFLRLFGYSAHELIGAHHAILIPTTDLSTPAYDALWAALRRGEPQSDEYHHLRKDGSDIWVQSTYTPAIDADGSVSEIVAFTTDVTAQRLKAASDQGQITAIRKSQAVITFDMDGTVVDANDIFLEAMGYEFDEVEGRHHRMFVDPSYSHGPEYALFWSDLQQGHHQVGEYKRFGKNGREVWLQATYNPVLDLRGRPIQIVKYASVVTREKLRQADHQGQIASIHKSQCVISFDMDGTILDANDNFLALTGYRLAQVRGRHHRMFVDEATAESQEYRDFWSELARGRHQAAEYKRICRDHREIWLRATYNPIFDMNGRPFKVVKYATDVTQERLRQVDYQGQVSAIHKSQCVVAFDMAGTVIDANDNFLAAMGYQLDEIRGRHHSMFVDAEMAASEPYATFWATLRSGTFLSAKFKRLGKDDREVWIQASYNPILDLDGRPFKVIKIATDVTADVALASDLSQARLQAEHDTATALPNRVRLSRFMTSVLAEPGSRLALLYLDLDHFKPINDRFGHHVGDHVLRETAARLRAVVGGDQLVARVGGDEFVVAAPNLQGPDIEELCRRLIAVVQAPIPWETGTVTVGLSIGVAVSPGDATMPDELLRCADVALYGSKGNGRGAYSFYASDMNVRIAADRHLADDMRRGMEAGEFALAYQPRLDASTGTPTTLDVLVRWNHPERDRIEPVDVILAAETSGLARPIAEWTLRNAARACTEWAAIGIAVDLSPAQFRDIDLIPMMERILAESALAPRRLELGIPEAALMDDGDRALSALQALKALGVRLALSDFGERSAPLADLRRYPLDVVKFDRRFTTALGGGGLRPEVPHHIQPLRPPSAPSAGIQAVGRLFILDLAEGSQVREVLLAEPMDPADVPAVLRGDIPVLAAA